VVRCGHCGETGQTVEHVRRCSRDIQADDPRRDDGPTPTLSSPQPQPRKKGSAVGRGKTKLKADPRRFSSSRPKVTDALRPSPGTLGEEEARQKYRSGASQPLRSEAKSERRSASDRTSRGGRNFDRYGMVNPPPSGKPAAKDY
jgi:hypothetical protein